jgi:hypothetical protein
MPWYPPFQLSLPVRFSVDELVLQRTGDLKLRDTAKPSHTASPCYFVCCLLAFEHKVPASAL